MKAIKHPKVIDLGLIGVLPEYAMKGISSAIIWEIMKMFTEQGIKIKALIARKLPDGEGVIRWNKALEKSIDGPFLPEE